VIKLAIEFSIDPTPNPNALKFTANSSVLEGRISYKSGDQPEDPISKALLEIKGVESIFGFQDFITVNKTIDANWDEIVPKVQAVFEREF
jgi:hypothetical protein